jgi:GntR family transcriptional regulator, carbon starvation induced regulator
MGRATAGGDVAEVGSAEDGVGAGGLGRLLTRGQWVDQRLRQAILYGELEPGKRLVAADLADRWQVSPTPVREAFQRMAAEGLVDFVPQRGARVAALSTKDLLETYELRLVLESRAFQKSLANGDESYRQHVKDTLDPLLDAYRDDPIDRRVSEAAHRAFHVSLLSACGSELMLRFTSSLIDRSVRYRVISTVSRGGAARVIEEHQLLWDICRTANHEEAGRALRRHLRLTVKAALKHTTD